MRILVTGATGFLGRHVITALSDAGHEVISSSRGATGPRGAALHVAHDFISAVPFPDVGRLDAIVHLAGDGDVQRAASHPVSITQVNAQGTMHALGVAQQTDAAFLLASTQRVYRPGPEPLGEDAPKEPTEPYGYSKLAAELYVEMASRIFGVRAAILRFFTVYGPGQMIMSGTSGVVAILGQRAVAGEPMLVLSHHRKDLVEVSDAAGAIVLALQHATVPARPYNIATGVPTSVLDLGRALRKAAGCDSEIVEDYSEGDPGDLIADITRARLELGYEPRVHLEEGLRRYVDWLRSPGPYPA